MTISAALFFKMKVTKYNSKQICEKDDAYSVKLAIKYSTTSLFDATHNFFLNHAVCFLNLYLHAKNLLPAFFTFGQE